MIKQEKPGQSNPKSDAVPLAIREFVGNIAVEIVRRRLASGGTVEIPSLGITLGPKTKKR